MKYERFRRIPILLFALFITFVCPGQEVKDSSAGKFEKIEISLKEINKNLSRTDSTIKKIVQKIDSAARKDSAIATDTTIMFNKWHYYKIHPELLYTKLCTTCGGQYIAVKVVTFVLLLVFLYMAFHFLRKSALCRDESYFTDPADGKIKLRIAVERPFSYAKVQMFWWTVIIITCYGLFFAITGNLLPLNPTSVLLLGGGLVTQFFGKIIDNSQKEADKKKETDPTKATDQFLPARHQDITPTQDFFTDILSDDNGISMHRLQSVAFNIIYGIGFISFFVTSICCKKYPLIDYEEWQLTLLGISTMGYLGLKTKENGKDSEAARVNEAQNNDQSTNPGAANDGEMTVPDEANFNNTIAQG